MNGCCDKWHLTFSDPPEMCVKFGTDIRPVINTQAVTDYATLINKPSINGVTLEGDKTNEELNINSISNLEIEEILTKVI